MIAARNAAAVGVRAARPIAQKQQKRGIIDYMTNYPDKVNLDPSAINFLNGSLLLNLTQVPVGSSATLHLLVVYTWILIIEIKLLQINEWINSKNEIINNAFKNRVCDWLQNDEMSGLIFILSVSYSSMLR